MASFFKQVLTALLTAVVVLGLFAGAVTLRKMHIPQVSVMPVVGMLSLAVMAWSARKKH